MQLARLPEVLVKAIVIYTLFLYIFYGIKKVAGIRDRSAGV
jgi:hypothetical protein